MKFTATKCRISGVAVGELEANLLSTTPILRAKAALVDTTGLRYGLITCEKGWSEETQKAFISLIELMEKDILSTVFEPDESATVEPEPKQL